MTESVMFCGIGFVVAALLGLLIVLHVHNRSARLEFQADVRQLEEQLTVALGERSKLQREIAAIKRDAELAGLPSASRAYYSASGSTTSPTR